MNVFSLTSKHFRQNVCWHGRTFDVVFSRSKHTEHSNKSFNVCSSMLLLLLVIYYKLCYSCRISNCTLSQCSFFACTLNFILIIIININKFPQIELFFFLRRMKLCVPPLIFHFSNTCIFGISNTLYTIIGIPSLAPISQHPSHFYTSYMQIYIYTDCNS